MNGLIIADDAEQCMERIEEMVEQVEQRGLSMDRALALYRTWGLDRTTDDLIERIGALTWLAGLDSREFTR